MEWLQIKRMQLLMLLLVTSLQAPLTWAQAEYVVIVNAGSALDKIDRGQLERIYLAKSKVLPNGEPVSVIDREDGVLRQAFYRQVVRRSDKQLRYYWSRMMFSGNARPPKRLATDQDVLSYVSQTPGAVGYIDKRAISGAGGLSANVKVVSLSGR